MKLFVDSSILLKKKKAIATLFSEDGHLSLHVFPNRRAHFRKVRKAVPDTFKIKPTYTIAARDLSEKKIRYYNYGKVFFDVVADRPLTKRQKELLQKTQKTLLVRDVSGDPAVGDFLRSCSNVVLDGQNGNLGDAVAFDLAGFERTAYTCHFSSCLGDVLYLDRSGRIYFCPYHTDASYLCDLKEVGEVKKVFNNPTFGAVLQSAIEKRKVCSQACALFSACGGGCPLESVSCEDLKNGVAAAAEERKSILESKADLKDLPLYKKESLIKEISKCVR